VRWKPIVVGIVDIGYEVSDTGKVRISPLKAFVDQQNIFKPVKFHLSRGYHKVKLPLPGGGHRWFYVHILVMGAFGPPKSFDGALVNHKDANKRNNDISNLEWATPSENTKHAYDVGVANGKKGSKHHNSKLTEADVLGIRAEHNGGVSQTSLARRYGVSRKLIWSIINRKAWRHV